MAITHVLEISFDPLSDTTPTWTDLSSRLLEVRDVTVGVDNDMDDPKPGAGTFLLDNRDRALEPGYASSPYYPNVRPLRRLRWRINDGVTTHSIFFGFIVDWGPVWPDSTINQIAEIRAVDGHMILELDRLDLLDPPAASSYEEVVMHDEPWGYWKLNEKAGAKIEATAGPEGTFHNTPTHGASALITGETGTSTLFTAAASERGRVPVKDVVEFTDANAVSAEAWVKYSGSTETFVAGPARSGGSTWILQNDSGLGVRFSVSDASGNSTEITGAIDLNDGEPHHVAGTWDGQTVRVYGDGVQLAELSGPRTMATPLASGFVDIANVNGSVYFDGQLAHVAVYEKALSAERIAAHYAAGSSGFAQQTAGARISAVANSDLWSEAGIDAGTHTLQPVMEHGQSRLEEILNATRAELNPPFYFDGDGNPIYRGWDWLDGAASQATFGTNTGEVPYLTLDVVADDHIYNVATVAREGGLAQTATDAASISEFRDRDVAITGLLHTDDAECLVLANAIIARHSTDELRIKSITLTGDDSTALAQILTRDPGDLIRVKLRPKGGTAQDRVSYILGRSLSVGENRQLVCTWNLSRGFNAAAGDWRLGISGFSELNTTAVFA